ncbi:MAG: hypothetical protein IKM54_04720, partial [Butyricicoccus sp.]|nr:hypothetical protein [Butyricicoccus sp.]
GKVIVKPHSPSEWGFVPAYGHIFWYSVNGKKFFIFLNFSFRKKRILQNELRIKILGDITAREGMFR